MRKRQVFLQRFLGHTENVLFEQSKNGQWQGLTDTYIRVSVKSGKDLRNRLLPVALETIEGQNIVGRLL